MNICIECRRLIRLWFLFAVVVYAVVFGLHIPPSLIFLLASFMLFASLGFWGGLIEVFTILLPVTVLYFFTDNIFLIYLIPVTNILLFMSYRSGRLMAAFISYLYIILWCFLTITTKADSLSIIITCICLFNMMLHIKGLFYKHTESLHWLFIVEKQGKTTDDILSALKEGLYDAKGSVTYADNINSIDKNIILYVNTKYSSINPAYLLFLYKNLPYGKGRKAFIIYTGLFFPEMAYIPLWIILALKGYNVTGRTYYIYSLAEIKFANIFFASDRDMLNIIKRGISDMADGFKSAMPLYIHILPASLISYTIQLVKNRFNVVS